jgi:predicted Na+-dependent transporter
MQAVKNSKSHLSATAATRCSQAVNGNTALALLLTVSSNLLGIFTMPFVMCSLLGGTQSSFAIGPAALCESLVRNILLPLLAGVAARAWVPGITRVPDEASIDQSNLRLVIIDELQVLHALHGSICKLPENRVHFERQVEK